MFAWRPVRSHARSARPNVASARGSYAGALREAHAAKAKLLAHLTAC
jgi:hypothetical protein